MASQHRSSSALERLLSKLGLPREPYRPDLRLFPELDVARLKCELRLDELGKERGAQEQPATDTTAPDDIELQVTNLAESEAKHTQDACHDQLRTYAERLNALDVGGRSVEIEADSRDAVADFKAHTHQGLDELHAARRRLIETEREREAFRREHGLHRTAHLPSSHVLHVGVLLTLLIVEAVLNGYLLAAGDEFGLLGGFFQAVIIAVLNIGGGFLAGRVTVPWLIHRRFGWKIIGGLGFLLWLGYLGAFNLLVAHYRGALGGDMPETAHIQAGLAFVANPFGIIDVKSWLLVGLGLLFGAVALIDGLFWDDPYPGYGRVERKHQAAVDRYTDLKADLITELAERKDVFVQALEASQGNLVKRRNEFSAVVEARLRLLRGFPVHLDHLEGAANEFLATYREANRRARKSAAPERFGAPYRLVRPELAAPLDHLPDQARLDAQVDAARARLSEAIRDVFDAYEAALERYRQIEDLLATTTAPAGGPSPDPGLRVVEKPQERRRASPA
ncbi:MAG: hypothetical protein ACREJ5_08140 [Geminicoccaceae bacterium]